MVRHSVEYASPYETQQKTKHRNKIIQKRAVYKRLKCIF